MTVRIQALVLAAAACAGCATAPPAELTEAKRIALVRYQDAQTYFVGIPIPVNAGILVALAMQGHFEDKANRFNRELTAKLGATSLEKEFQQIAVGLLQRRGFEVLIVPGVRDRYGELDLDSVTVPSQVDVLIDLRFLAGYFAAVPTSEYRPRIDVLLRVYSRDKRRLYQKPETWPGRQSEPPERYYPDFDALLANAVKAFERLRPVALESSAAAVDLLRGSADAAADLEYVKTQIANGARPRMRISAAGPAAATEAAELGFPKRLTGDEIVTHFKRNVRISANPAQQRPFALSIHTDGTAERTCPNCQVPRSRGSYTIKQSEAAVCFEWKVPYPPSGCFSLMQTGSAEFVMLGIGHPASIFYSASP